jgi:hypothetical protein
LNQGKQQAAYTPQYPFLPSQNDDPKACDKTHCITGEQKDGMHGLPPSGERIFPEMTANEKHEIWEIVFNATSARKESLRVNA